MNFLQALLADPFRTIRVCGRVAMAGSEVRAAHRLPIGPIIAYGHPKTATTSTQDALEDVAGIRAFHAHVLRPRHFTWRRNNLVPPLPNGICPEDSPYQWALDRALAGSRTVRLVTLVRDPVAVQVSWFFFGLQRWLASRRKVDLNAIPPARLRKLFHGTFPRDGILNWFQEEWCPLTGIDLHDLAAVRERGFAGFEFGPHHACVFHAHASDERKQRWLEEWLDLPAGSIRFPRANVAPSRPDEAAAVIRASVGADEDLLDRAYGSAYAQTLFDQDTLSAWRARWEACAASSPGP